MADRPSFQFYPKDWRNNAKLQRCSAEARGAWMDVMCLLHDSDEYGVLRWPLVDIAQAVRLPVKLLREIATKGVLKGADAGAEAYVHRPFHAGKYGEPVTLVAVDGGPVWYCSRFVKDEWQRSRRGASTRFTADSQPSPKTTPTGTPTRPVGERQGDGASSASSSPVEQEQGQKQKTAPRGVEFTDVAPQVVADFTAHRKALRAPITQTGLDAIRREAGRAGLTLEAALAMCCARGWRGFKAEWVTEQNARAGPGNAPPGKTMQALKTLEEMKNGLAPARDSDRLPKTALLGPGPDASG